MKTCTFAALSAVITLTLLTVVVAAETRYVSLKGSHQPPFTTWKTAAKDIQSAIDAASAGDQIMVASGTYRIGSTIALNKAVTVKSDAGARTTILDGGELSKKILCLTITATPAIFDGFTITRFDEGVRFETREDTRSMVRNCIIVHNRSHGIFFNHGGCAKNCTVAYNGGAGLYAYDMGGGGDDPDNMILFGNSPQFVRDSANIRLEHSYTDDPHFVSTKDFRLRPDSPCIDAGANEAWMSDAIDGDGGPRIQDGNVDIGAYEHKSQEGRRHPLRRVPLLACPAVPWHLGVSAPFTAGQASSGTRRSTSHTTRASEKSTGS